MKREKITIFVIFGLLIWLFGPYLLYQLDTSMDNNDSRASIDNTAEPQKANIENQYRVTITQAFVGIAVLYGIYQTWQRITIAEVNLKVSQEGQITERFTRAIDQLGNEKMEIKLGGIYALERIANGSDKDYWSIMEILTAYVRMNSSAKAKNKKGNSEISMDIQADEVKKNNLIEVNEVTFDIQTVLIVLGRRKYAHTDREPEGLNLENTYLNGAALQGAHLEGAKLNLSHLQEAFLSDTHLEEAKLAAAHLDSSILEETHLEMADLRWASLKYAYLEDAHLEEADLRKAHLEDAFLRGAHLERADLRWAHLERADLQGAFLTGASLVGAFLTGAENLTVDQLSKVETLYDVKNLDEELSRSLERRDPEKYRALTKKPDYIIMNN